jgi:hypothetical protein
MSPIRYSGKIDIMVKLFILSPSIRDEAVYNDSFGKSRNGS